MKGSSVLHICPVWLPQTQTWIKTQVCESQRLGVHSHVVCERTKNIDQFGSVNVHCLADKAGLKQIWDRGLRKLRVRRHLNHVVETGKQTGATIVHSHFADTAWANLGAVRRLNAKHVVTFYGYDVNLLPTKSPVWLTRYQQLFAEAELFLCEGSHMARCIVELGCPAHKVKVQHLGADVDRLEFRPRQWEHGQPLKVLIAASFREKKGIPYAIEALGLLRNDVPFELTIIGDAVSDAASQLEKAKIFAALDRTGLTARAQLLGYQPHARLIKEAYAHHLFLHPSVTASDGDTEGGAPVGIIEMLATGMPVVSTTHCDIPEVMGKALACLLVPERDITALAGVIRALIAAPERWGEYTNAGRARVMEEYHQAIQAERLVKLYQEINEL